jgi:tetratricopeptide (TPR) repeat protein
MLSAALAQGRDALAAGHHGAAAQALQPALTASAESDDPRSWCEAHALLAHARFGLGQFEASMAHAQKAATGWQTLGDGASACQAWRLMAFAMTESGDHAGALAAARTAFDAAELHGLAFEALQLMALIGSLHERLGDFDAGELLLLQGLSRAQDRREQPIVAHICSALVTLLISAHEQQLRQGDIARAQATANRLAVQTARLHALSREERSALARAVQLSSIGAALAVGDRLADGAEMLEQSLATCRAEDFGAVAMKALLRLARIRLRQGLVDDAEAACSELGRWLERHPHPQASADRAGLQRSIAAARGQPEGPEPPHAGARPVGPMREHGFDEADLLDRVRAIEARALRR